MRTVKIIVDLLMLVFIILSVTRWDGDPTFHIVVGGGCTLFFVIHFALNVKPFKTMTKNFGKLRTKMRLQYIVDVLLLIIWSTAIITGFLAILPYLNEIENISALGRVHGVFARVGCGFAVIHLIQHFKQIGSYFRKAKKHIEAKHTALKVLK